MIRVVAETTGTYYGQLMTAGDIYTIAGDGTGQYSGDGGPAVDSSLNYPEGLAVDGSGNVLIADSGNNVVRTVAATTGTFYGESMAAGDIYTIAGNGDQSYSGDGGVAVAASLNFPEGLTVDSFGNVLVADSENNVIRAVASTTGTFYGQSMTAEDIYTIAGDGTAGSGGNGGPATSAELDIPVGIAVDQYGNLAISDSGNNDIRGYADSTGTFYGGSAMAGDIYLAAGTGTAGYAGDGGVWADAEFDSPEGIAINSSGDLLIADMLNNRIRELTP